MTDESDAPREIGRGSDGLEGDEEVVDRPSLPEDSPEANEGRGDSISRDLLAAYMEEYSGPIPHPVTLRQINEVVPGAAKQIIDDAHGQTAHRQGLEVKSQRRHS